MTKDDFTRQDILLESGTNEVEIMEFVLRDQYFGVNVAKVKQMLSFDRSNLTELPLSPDVVMGLYTFRDSAIPLLDLGIAFDLSNEKRGKKPLIMVCEFNKIINGFFIDSVKRIHRLPWSDIRPLDEAISKNNFSVTGAVTLKDHEILLIDLEAIIGELNPELKEKDIEEETSDDQNKQTDQITIIAAEDSAFMRKQILRNLNKAGFNNIHSFPDGKKAYDAVLDFCEQAKKEAREVTDFFQVIVTDIEMPLMDGLTLCKNVKDSPVLKNVFVLVYSSLITDEMAMKCKAVGADAYLSKTQMDKMITILNEFAQKRVS